jgi:hypothetical protein
VSLHSLPLGARLCTLPECLIRRGGGGRGVDLACLYRPPFPRTCVDVLLTPGLELRGPWGLRPSTRWQQRQQRGHSGGVLCVRFPLPAPVLRVQGPLPLPRVDERPAVAQGGVYYCMHTCTVSPTIHAVSPTWPEYPRPVFPTHTCRICPSTTRPPITIPSASTPTPSRTCLLRGLGYPLIRRCAVDGL